MPGYVRSLQVSDQFEIDRSRYPWTVPCLKDFECLSFDPRLTYLVGENGSGKSTLIEALAVKLGMPAEGGSKHHQVRTHDTHSTLEDALIVVRSDYPADTFFLRAESFYNVATYLTTTAREGGGVPKAGWVHERSHGEGFIDLVASLNPEGLYLFDEPESALSPQRQLEFILRISELLKEKCQVIIATHSPIILSIPDATIYQLSENGIEETTYEQTEPYWLTLDFLKNRERYLKSMGIE